MLRSSIPTTISITENIDQKCGTILADPTQIHQILMNLCTNAFHSMEETGGEISVTLKTTFIESGDEEMMPSVPPGQHVELSVSDTGGGIMPAGIDKIFDPYYTTKETGRGTGMGLAIIHGIMKNYGGAITVESRPGEGSTFRAYFPVVEEEARVETAELQIDPLGTERILLIDDEIILCEMGKEILERQGYAVTIQNSSLEALATFKNAPNDFDLLVTDQTMPGMTGSDLARRVLQIRPDMPIILCTGYSSIIDEHSATEIGISAFARKPFSKDAIGKLIRKVLDGIPSVS